MDNSCQTPSMLLQATTGRESTLKPRPPSEGWGYVVCGGFVKIGVPFKGVIGVFIRL